MRALWGLKYTCLALKDAGEDESAATTTDKLLLLVEEKTRAAYNHLKTKDYIQ